MIPSVPAFRSLALSAACALTLGVAPLLGQDQEANPTSQYRSALMGSVQQHMGALGALLSGNVEFPGHAVQHASAIHGITAMLGDAFLEGTGGEGTRAKAEIWQNWADFEAKLEGFRSAASMLHDAALTRDGERIAEAFQAFRGTCRDCHSTYRAPAN